MYFIIGLAFFISFDGSSSVRKNCLNNVIILKCWFFLLSKGAHEGRRGP